MCEYSRSRSFHYDLILQDQASGERSQDQWSSGIDKINDTASKNMKNTNCDVNVGAKGKMTNSLHVGYVT